MKKFVLFSFVFFSFLLIHLIFWAFNNTNNCDFGLYVQIIVLLCLVFLYLCVIDFSE